MVQVHVRAPILKASVPQQPQGGFCKPVIVGASPTRGSSLWDEGGSAKCEFNTGPTRISPLTSRPFPYVDHDVRAASRPVTAFVPVQVRLVNPTFLGLLTGCDVLFVC